MKSWRRVIVLASVLVSGCPRGGETETPRVACSDPRPEICTREYLPVCGTIGGGATRTYGNACEACADPAVIGHRSAMTSMSYY